MVCFSYSSMTLQFFLRLFDLTQNSRAMLTDENSSRDELHYPIREINLNYIYL